MYARSMLGVNCTWRLLNCLEFLIGMNGRSQKDVQLSVICQNDPESRMASRQCLAANDLLRVIAMPLMTAFV